MAQADCEGCELIFSSQWPAKVGKGTVCISLSEAAFAALPDDLARRGATVERGHWGYRVLIVSDPDGDQLYFPDPSDTGG